MSLDTLQDLYVDGLKDLYSAENQILKALPKMIKAAANPELKSAFADHLVQTEGHVERLVQLCEELGVSPKGKKCTGMEGVLKEGAELIAEKPDADVLDAGLAAAAQHVEHYEMAGYGSVRTWAEQLGFASQAKLLQQTLDEEKAADRLLTQLATSQLNTEAENGSVEVAELADVAPKSRAKSKATRSESQNELR